MKRELDEVGCPIGPWETEEDASEWFDQDRRMFLLDLGEYLKSPVDGAIKRQEVEATINAIRGLRDLLLGDV